jgi:hypothetical protein
MSVLQYMLISNEQVLFWTHSINLLDREETTIWYEVGNMYFVMTANDSSK